MYTFSQELGLFIHWLTPTISLWVVSAGIIIFLFLVRQKRKAIIFVLALCATNLIVGALKLILAVPRPEDALVTLSSYAFPSGHAAGSMFLATMLTWLYATAGPKRSNVSRAIVTCSLFALASLVSYSRIAISVHTPAQVIAGCILGIIVPLAIIAICTKKNASDSL